MNLIGIDFEDWYHPELVKKFVKDKKHEPIMFKGLDKIIELLRKNDTQATFFVVGELIKKNPEILDKILENDHEVGFHTMYHDRIDSIEYKEKFNDEIKQFAELTNKRSKGFRAPTFSLNSDSSWIIEKLVENDYLYDSSVVPAKLDLYGIPDAEHKPYRISAKSLENNSEDSKLLEFPLLVTKFLGKKIPAGGGFFLRTLPDRIIKNAIKNYEKQGIPSTFYIHSWELTPEFMPKIKLPQKENFVTYHNINKSYEKMNNLLKEFEFTTFSNYISKHI
jgi:polysaccharide deacetylase family protein (PEP-CTERM system associated)|tara:strand:- start:803 stop:1636 length:834 start_codon:yes stop_codon:yes gene_type:complete